MFFFYEILRKNGEGGNVIFIDIKILNVVFFKDVGWL